MSTLTLTSPVMSDRTLLLSVEDLISIAMGPKEGNTINFKVIQTILHILARQMRVLEQKVILVTGELPTKRKRSRRRGEDYDEGSRRRTPPEFSTEEERLAWERGGRGSSGRRGYDDDDDYDDGGRGGRGRSRGGVDDDDERGGRDRAEGRAGGAGRDDAGYGRSREHGGRDYDDIGSDRAGGRGGHDRDDDQGRGRAGVQAGHDRDDRDGDMSGGLGGQGRDVARDGRHERAVGRPGDREDGSLGGRNRSGGPETHDEDRGGRDRVGGQGRGGEVEQERGGGGARAGGRMDHDERGHDGAGGGKEGRDIDVQGAQGGGGGRGAKDLGEHGGQGGGGKGGRDFDEGRGGGKGGKGGRDYDEDSRGGGKGGKGGRDFDEESRGGRRGGKGGRDFDEDGREVGKGGRDGRDFDQEGHRDGRGGRGGRDFDEEGREGGRGGRGGRDFDEEGRGGRAGGRGGRDYDDDGRGGGRGGKGGRDFDEGRGGAGMGRGRDDVGGRQGLGVREIDGPGKEKLLVVEKGPTTVGSSRDRDSIAVVTQSQFQLLEEQVDELWRAAGPLPAPTMPDNKQLRQDLAAGASLTDAMQAMQVSARVQAAEQAIMKLGGLLTQLAASGALPEDAAGALMAAGGWNTDDEVQLKSASSGTAYKSIRVDPSAKELESSGTLGQSEILGEGGSRAVPFGGAKPPTSAGSTKPSILTSGAAQYITKPEMGTALVSLRDEVTNTLQAQIEKASAAADSAERIAKSVGEKVEELMKMDDRLSSLYSLVEDYSEQLNGFDAGLNTQMSSFKEQMTSLRAELQGGLQQLEASNANPETAAVMELNERFEGLVHGLDDTLLQHKALNDMQHQLTQELKTLVDGVEMLREQKADRDELLDILRDKADISMLEGLVRQEEFDSAQEDLEHRLEKCNNKFQNQDKIWMDAMKDLQVVVDTKAQLTDLMKVRDDATAQLRAIDDRINQLSLVLGEPKAAMLMRKLARDAVCAACLAPALMAPGGAALPPALPAARPAPPATPAPPCAPEPTVPDYPDFRTHRCHRWVGGSHTLLLAARAHPAPIEVATATNKFTGYGDDGRLYWLETECQPCVECNPEPAPAPAPPATARSDAGDAPPAHLAMPAELEESCPC